jgi:hypothetical protein
VARCTPKCQTPISGVGLDGTRKDGMDGIDSIEPQPPAAASTCEETTRGATAIT